MAAAVAPWLEQAPRASSSRFRYAPPRLRVARPYELTHGARVVEFAKLHGKVLSRWQRDVLNDWGAVTPDMQFVHRRNGLDAPRQTGKSDDAVEWAAYLAAELGMAVLYTAHNYSTTCEMRRRLQDIFGTKAKDPAAKNPRFNALVEKCENKTAQEAIFLKNGGRIHFSTRTKTATLGYSFDVIIYDEAQELTNEQMQAISATATSGQAHNPQEIYLGTPCRPGGFGTVFASRRSEAHSDPGDDLSWWEWGVAEVGDITDESRWFDVNPSLGEGVANLDAIRLNCRNYMTQGDEGILAFAQEFLGYWLPGKALEIPDIDADAWDSLATAEPPTAGKVVFAFKFSPDGRTVALAACRREKGGKPHCEVVRYENLSGGTAWCAAFAFARKGTAAGFVADGGGYATDLRDELRRGGLPKSAVREPGSQGMAAASAKLMAAIDNRAMTHFGQPALDACAKSAKKRTIGRSGFGFECIGGKDPTMIEAVALALWGIDEIKRDPTRRAIVR